MRLPGLRGDELQSWKEFMRAYSRTISGIALLLMLIWTPGSKAASPASVQASPEPEIRQLLEGVSEAYAAGDASAMVALMTPDALLLPPGRPPLSGSRALPGATTADHP